MIKAVELKLERPTAVVWGPCNQVLQMNLYKALERLYGYSPLFIVLAYQEEITLKLAQRNFAKLQQKGALAYTPVRDMDVQPVYNMLSAISLTAEALRIGRPVVLCCRGGVGRSTTAVLGALEVLSGMKWTEIKELLAQHAIMLDPSLEPHQATPEDVKKEMGPECPATLASSPPEDVECPEWDDKCFCPQHGLLDGLYELVKSLAKRGAEA